MAAGAELIFMLFTSKSTTPSFVRRVADMVSQMPIKCQLWTFDVESRADMAERFNVIATPMLIRQHLPSKRLSSLVGDCCDAELQSFLLDLRIGKDGVKSQAAQETAALRRETEQVLQQIDELQEAVTALQKTAIEQKKILDRQRKNYEADSAHESDERDS